MSVNETPVTLEHQLSRIPSQTWLSVVQRQAEKLFHLKNSTIKDIAAILPNSTAIRYNNFYDEKYLQNMSTQYLTRVQRGERRMNDARLAARAEERLFVDRRILNSPLCEILKKPDMQNHDFKRILEIVSEELEGRVFEKSSSARDIKQKRCYWIHENLFLINSEEFVTYRLLLINKHSCKSTPTRSSISKLVLLFWRVLMTCFLTKHAEILCEAFFRYLKINLPARLIPAFPEDINHFQMLRNVAFPSVSIYPVYTNSFDNYRTYTREVCQKAASNLFEDNRGLVPHSLYTEIIYLADRYAQKWMSGKIGKIGLFDTDTKEYCEIHKSMHFSSTHRIW